MGKQWKQCQTLFLQDSQITADGDCSHEIKRRLLLGRKLMTNLDSIFKSKDITFPTKVRLVKAMVFPVSCMDVRVGLWRRLRAKVLMLLNCGVGEDSCESLGDQNQLILKEISPAYSLEGLMLKLKLWAPDAKNWLIKKDPDDGQDWRQEEKGMTEDEMMVGWHHWLNGHGFGWTPGVGDGQGSLACYNAWVEKSRTQLSDWTELMYFLFVFF